MLRVWNKIRNAFYKILFHNVDHAIGQFNLILIETKYLIRFCWKYLLEIFTKGREMLFDGEKILL